MSNLPSTAFTSATAQLARSKAGPRGPSKATVAMRTLIEGVLDDIDAHAKLKELAESLDPSDRKTFWTLAGKLLPATMIADVNVTGSHSMLAEAAGAVPPHVVAAMLEAGRKAMLAGPPPTVIDIQHSEVKT